MAITASIVDIRGKAYEPIIEEILFENKTVSENLVSFETDIKSESIFTENVNTVTMQPFTSGIPTSAGTLGVVDTMITPVKVLYYNEFDMNSLRSSRFKRDMKAGAWNTASNEFEKTVLASYGKLISYDAEKNFWSGITAATQTAIAALTAGGGNGSIGAAEKAWAAAQTAGQVDGVIARMMYNNALLGTRVKVAGAVISAANIATEYAKAYAAIPAVVINASAEKPYLFAPYSHKQFINIYNVSATYRDLFSVDMKADKYFYNGIEIKFVPLTENTIIAAIPSNIVWCTDLTSDISYMEVNKIANNREDMFIKNVFTLFAHVVNQKYNVLYQG